MYFSVSLLVLSVLLPLTLWPSCDKSCRKVVLPIPPFGDSVNRTSNTSQRHNRNTTHTDPPKKVRIGSQKPSSKELEPNCVSYSLTTQKQATDRQQTVMSPEQEPPNMPNGELKVAKLEEPTTEDVIIARVEWY
ncbi:hypothetical protein EDD17DRAFT_1901513 [Pisolithus thermaeus]|nr:hypothetical protein EDD17DRAFT_1901513 [Pisolithus thermaeus]